MIIKVKKLYEMAEIPRQMTTGAAGFDMVATSMEFIKDDDGTLYQIKYGTGLCVEIPEGYVGLIKPRSSIAHTGLRLSNSVGVIDSDYRGEITAYFDVADESKIHYKIGERIMQLLLIRLDPVIIKEVKELSNTKRGTHGYGSTGR